MNMSSADSVEIRAEQQAVLDMHAAGMYRERVEQAAIKIFAAMQANPNWNVSNRAQREAVDMAEALIAAVDDAFTPKAPREVAP